MSATSLKNSKEYALAMNITFTIISKDLPCLAWHAHAMFLMSVLACVSPSLACGTAIQNWDKGSCLCSDHMHLGRHIGWTLFLLYHPHVSSPYFQLRMSFHYFSSKPMVVFSFL